MKVCKKCLALKFPEEFNRNASQADGLQIWCKSCHLAHKRAKTTRAVPLERLKLKPRDLRHIVEKFIIHPNGCIEFKGSGLRPHAMIGGTSRSVILVMMQFVGRYVPDKEAHHTCLNGWCCNTDHIEMVSSDQHKEIHRLLRKAKAA